MKAMAKEILLKVPWIRTTYENKARIAQIQSDINGFASHMESQPLQKRAEIADPKPLISSCEVDYLSRFFIKGRRDTYQLLPSPKGFLEAESSAAYSEGLRIPLKSHLDPEHNITAEVTQADFERFVGLDISPIPPLEDREFYSGDRHLKYWESGLVDWLISEKVCSQHGRSLQPGDQILEIGCSTGRVLRHFASQRPDLTVWGCDINGRHVEWMKRYLPRVRMFQNTILPHLPLEDNSMSLVTAYSVFTHIDDLEDFWLHEIRRVLKPGGIALITVLTEKTWSEVRPDGKAAFLIGKYSSNPRQDYTTDDSSLFLKPMPEDRVTFWGPGRIYNTDVYRSHRYIKQRWNQGFKLLDIMVPEDGRFGLQDLVFLQKV